MSSNVNSVFNLRPQIADLLEKLDALKAFFIALRPNQWIKNLLVFAAPFFAFQIDLGSVSSSFTAFSLFCLISSSFYLLNDVKDIDSDRQHPVKCNRPIAARKVSVVTAVVMAILFLSVALVFSWFYFPALGVVLTSYALIQVAYNLKLKQLPLLDIGCIASGFVLRTCAGFVVTDLSVSLWFLVCTAMLALFLAIEKRKAELRYLQCTGKEFMGKESTVKEPTVKVSSTRAVLKVYSLPLLNRMESTVVTGAVMSYAIWSSGWDSNSQIIGAPTPWMILTLPFVLYGIFRYQIIGDFSGESSYELRENSQHETSLHEQTETPEKVLLFDRQIRYTVISWLITCTLTLWLNSQGII